MISYITHNHETIKIFLTVFFLILLKVKVTVYSVEGTRKTKLWNYKLTKPCTHFVIGPMLERYLHAKDCIIKKVSIDFIESLQNFMLVRYYV